MSVINPLYEDQPDLNGTADTEDAFKGMSVYGFKDETPATVRNVPDLVSVTVWHEGSPEVSNCSESEFGIQDGDDAVPYGTVAGTGYAVSGGHSGRGDDRSGAHRHIHIPHRSFGR